MNAKVLSQRQLFFITFLLAACSIIYELLIANTLVYLTDNIVLWQSLTIGIFIAGLGIGTFLTDYFCITNPLNSLFKIELGLSIFGAVSTLFIFLLHFIYRALTFNLTMDPLLSTIDLSLFSNPSIFWLKFPHPLVIFVVGCQLITLLIGILSGFEVPLLIMLGKSSCKKVKPNIILGLNYLGTLIGTICFAFILLPELDVLNTALLVAFLNWLICVILFLAHKDKPVTGQYFLSAMLLFFIFLFANQKTFYQWHLKAFYFLNASVSLKKIPGFIQRLPEIRRIRSPYQFIDILEKQYPFKVKDFILFINGHFQVSRQTEKYYHQSLAHLPIFSLNKIPKKILILGAGDGLLLREILKFDNHIERIVLVELDREIIKLSRTEPVLSLINEKSIDHPKVRVLIQDAFYFLRHTNAEFDAVIMDFPFPYNYDTSRLYSLEFFLYINNCLKKDGYLAFNFPVQSRNELSFDPVYTKNLTGLNSALYATLKKAGFDKIFSFGYDETFILTLGPDADEHFLNVAESDSVIGRLVDIEYLEMELKSMRPMQLVKPAMQTSVNSIFLPAIYNFQDPFFYFNTHNNAKLKKIIKKFSLDFAKEGTLFLEQKKIKEAIFFYNKAIKLSPAEALFYEQRAKARIMGGEVSQAILDLNEAIKFAPQLINAYKTRATLFFHKGDFEKALSDFSMAINILQPGYPGTSSYKKDFINSVDAFVSDLEKTFTGEKVNVVEAEKKLSNVEITKKLAEIFLNRASTFNKLGRKEKAYRDLEKALKLDPSLREQVIRKENDF
ncbi:hypothetical protein ACFL35_02205 [Candidatus Riflebacteria bacterium]